MKTFQGKVTSHKMDKTAVVEVARMWKHPKYKKRVKRTKKYIIHDEKNEAHVGDKVMFKESTPISKKKRFMLVKVEKGSKNSL